jgi:uncharacterized protein
MGKLVEVNIIALTASESHPGNYVVILEDEGGLRRLPVIIGPNEAQAIAATLEQMRPARPLTHDLFFSTVQALGATLGEVHIVRYEAGVFHALLRVRPAQGGWVEVDARTSDAIALATRFACPILVLEEIIEQTAIHIDRSKSFAQKRGTLLEYSTEELEALLAGLLAKEDYESAGRVRDALRQKKELGR